MNDRTLVIRSVLRKTNRVTNAYNNAMMNDAQAVSGFSNQCLSRTYVRGYVQTRRAGGEVESCADRWK